MRYICEHRRLGITILHSTKQEAEAWLREIFSEGAIVTDTHTGERGTIIASGEIIWRDGQAPKVAAYQPLNVERVREVHARDSQRMWTRNDPDLIPAEQKAEPKADQKTCPHCGGVL